MNKKIILNFATILAVAIAVAGATIAFDSDNEKSQQLTFTAGEIAIDVDGQSHWTKSYEFNFDKPCETNYINFVIENTGTNDANVWKRLVDVTNSGGDPDYPEDKPICSSEPEYEDGGGQFDQDGNPTGEGYEERNNLSAFMIYDMSICMVDEEYPEDCDVDPDTGAPTGQGWNPLIPPENEIRIDSVEDVWIKIADELKPGEKIKVNQSYHLMVWEDAQGQPVDMNWTQGDQLSFYIELEARQLSAPAPGQEGTVQLVLENKDPVTWEPLTGDNMAGLLTYDPNAETFTGNLTAAGLQASTSYCLIYYADPWPGVNGAAGKEIKCTASDGSGNINIALNEELNTDMPVAPDTNLPVGAKFWLVLDDDYSDGTGMTAWNPTMYLFDTMFGTYNDTGI